MMKKKATVQTKIWGFRHWLAAFSISFQFCHLSGFCLVFHIVFQRLNNFAVTSVRKRTCPGLTVCVLTGLKGTPAWLIILTLQNKNTMISCWKSSLGIYKLPTLLKIKRDRFFYSPLGPLSLSWSFCELWYLEKAERIQRNWLSVW